jgi:hypothetical protein
MKDHKKRRRWITPPPSQIASSPSSSPDHPGQFHYRRITGGGQGGFESVGEILERMAEHDPLIHVILKEGRQ